MTFGITKSLTPSNRRSSTDSSIPGWKSVCRYRQIMSHKYEWDYSHAANDQSDMTPETAKHLDQVEAAIKQARSVFIKYSYVDTLRNVVVIGLIDQMIEHHEAMVILIRAAKIGSAFALSRSIFE